MNILTPQYKLFIKSNIVFKGSSSMNSDTGTNSNIERHQWGDLTSDKIKNSQIGNFWQVDKNLYRGAQPGIDETRGGIINYEKLKADLKFLRDEKGVSIVLNLRNPNDNNTPHIELENKAIKELNNEAKLENSRNTKYKIPELIGINIPMDAGEAIPVKSEDVEKILGHFQKYSDKKFYIHCRSGNDRTGVGTALYRMWEQGLEKGVSFENIRQEMLDCGHAQKSYKGLIPSLAACIRYMGITPTYGNIKNAQGSTKFLWDFYQKNRTYIKKIAFN